MRFKSWLGLLGGVLLLGAAGGCDSGGTTAGVGGSAGAGGSGGSAAGATTGVTTCTLDSQCAPRVCSPDSRCVDCFDSLDCAMGLSCVAEQCVTPGGGGSGGSGGTTSGGTTSGGSGPVTTQCAGTQVMFVIQRSGSMFEDPDGDTSYWDMVREAVAGTEGVATTYASKLDMGALFFLRLQYDEEKSCPIVSSASPASSAAAPLAALFDTNQGEYETLADEQAKMDAPVPEAVSAAAALMTGTSKHVVLITTAVPDSCTKADTNCTVDQVVKAVQDAQKAGVTTHVIGLGDTDALNAADDEDGYATYLKQLANAGAGKPVAESAAFKEDCSDDDATATYSESGGDAQAFQATDAAAVKTAITGILSSICP